MGPDRQNQVQLYKDSWTTFNCTLDCGRNFSYDKTKGNEVLWFVVMEHYSLRFYAMLSQRTTPPSPPAT